MSRMSHRPVPPEFPALSPPPRILLGPGPSMIDPRVLQAMATPVVGYLDPSFLSLLDRIQVLLRYVFETQNEMTLAVPGTGSAAMEAAIANLVEPGDRVLVCVNGFFGERLAEMARRYGADLEILRRPWGQVVPEGEVEQSLRHRPAKVVAIVHGETSTGVLQPVQEIAQTVHAHGGVLIADAVTSLAGTPVGVDANGIDVCYSATQKCLGCPPGLGPITVSPRAMELIERREHVVSNFYLDLKAIARYWGPERLYHHTAPISSFYALYEGLRLVAEETLPARWQRHRRHAELLWEGLEDLGLELFVPREHRLPPLTTVRIPEGSDDLSTRRKVLEQSNIEFFGGFGELKGKVWRIGLMGASSREEYVRMLLEALREVLRKP